MLEIIAFVLFLIWALGYVMGYVFGGLIHLLLPIAVMAFLVQRRLKARAANLSDVSPAGILSMVLRPSQKARPNAAPNPARSRARVDPPLLSSPGGRSPSPRPDA